MTPERYQHIKSVFFEASVARGEAREAVLQRHCRDDATLRREVENLLAANAFDTSDVYVPFQPDAVEAVERAIDQLQREAPTSAASGIRPAPHGEAETPPRIAGYQIQRVIGRGGMGTVYEALQQKPKRTVAIKVMRAGVASRSTLRRFEYETQVLAQLRHPGIAQIYEAGTADTGSGPQPYFAMELLSDARPITAYAEEKKLHTRARLELMAQICDAVHHAHQKGVIHRDLKPGNILVDSSGQPKVLDFGVAKATESDMQVTTMHTDVGQLIGTLAYMSPEQVAADPAELDVRSDVYALGVVLFELLTERLPYDLTRKVIHEAARVIREQEPTRLSAVSRVFRGDIETIVLKAMEKDKTRRYQSAAEFAADLRRYLNYEPIIARPASTIYQFRRFARRNRAFVGGLAAVFVALLAGSIVSTWLAFRATAAERVATAERDRAKSEAVRADQTSVFIRTIFQGIDPYQAQGMDTTLLMALLSKAEERISKELAEQPLAEAAIRYTLGTAYMNLGRFGEADQNFRRCEELNVKHLGAEHRSTARVRTEQVDLLKRQGMHEEARALAATLSETARRLFGEDDAETLSVRGKLAESLFRVGRYPEAQAIQRDVLQRYIRLFGEQSHQAAGAMQNLAWTLYTQKKSDEAAELLTRAVDFHTRTLGADHSETLQAIAQLASVRAGQGKFDEAVGLHETAIAGLKRILGPRNPNTLNAMNNLAVTFQDADRHAEAETLHRQTFETRREVLGETHSETLLSKSNVAGALRKQRRFPEAETMVREVLDAQKRTLGEDHRDTLTSKMELAFCLEERGLQAEAAVLLGERVASYRRVRTEDDHVFRVAIYNWGAKLEDAGNREAAMPLFQEVLDLHEKYRGREEAYIAAANNGLAVCLNARGEYAEADKHFQKGLEMRRRLFGDTHRELLYSLNDFGAALIGRGEYSTAEPYLRDAMRISEAVSSPGEAQWATTRNLWGKCRSGQGAYAEAEPLLLAANEALRNGEYVQRDITLENLFWLVELYEAWDKAEPDTGKANKAGEWRLKLQAFESSNVSG